MRKLGRKALALLLALTMLVALIPAGAAPAWAEEDLKQGADNYYLIKDADDLLEFANIVDKNSGACARLTADINLNKRHL